MDKERVFMTGQPCDLYIFDTDVQLLEYDVECTPQHYAIALGRDLYLAVLIRSDEEGIIAPV